MPGKVLPPFEQLPRSALRTQVLLGFKPRPSAGPGKTPRRDKVKWFWQGSEPGQQHQVEGQETAAAPRARQRGASRGPPELDAGPRAERIRRCRCPRSWPGMPRRVRAPARSFPSGSQPCRSSSPWRQERGTCFANSGGTEGKAAGPLRRPRLALALAHSPCPSTSRSQATYTRVIAATVEGLGLWRS